MGTEPVPKPAILVADDEEAICFSLARFLKARGLTVHIAPDGRAAVDLYRRHRATVGAVFLDVRLPRLDGLQVLAAVRAINPSVPCCLMTAFRGDPGVHAALLDNRVPILDKPFNLDAFQALLERLLGEAEPSEQSLSRTHSVRRVALSFPLHHGIWSEIVRGVYAQAREGLPWEITLYTEEDVALALAEKPDGVIAMVRSARTAATLRAWTGPVVDTGQEVEGTPFIPVGFGHKAIGTLAAEHLLRLGPRLHAFVGDPALSPAFRDIYQGFQERLQTAGFSCLLAPPGLFGCLSGAGTTDAGHEVAWLRGLVVPAALYAPHDVLARRVCDRCREVGLRVPQDVAILGTQNDELLCETGTPPLSSVQLPGLAVGREAARILDAILSGQPAPRERVEFPACAVVTRQSTDLGSIDDVELGRAIQFLLGHYTERIGVGEIAAACGLSRSSLERRFRRWLGRSPLEELIRLRVERARHLLATTDAPIKQIAIDAGFRDAQHLTTIFTQKTGEPPARYRARQRTS